ncbi:unnamed protein product [Parnassius mnemosyne]|uniref:FP protein C-terminal domain-containing protein n=1 Tax=Parnassius mnemosyne TaxID=213953 RepID=A0AAV1KHN3_9NEOP
MAKCGGCGKFMPQMESVRCPKCCTDFHRACVKIADNARISATWICPGCKSRLPKGDNSTTPVKGLFSTSSPGDDMSSTGVTSKEDSTNLLTLEIRSFREDLQAARDDIKKEIKEMRQEITDFKVSLKSCMDRLDAMEDRLSSVEKRFEQTVPIENNTIQDTVNELRVQLQERDQELLLNDVEIAGIPENKGETPVHLVKLVAKKLGMDVDERDIVYAERVGLSRLNRVDENGTSPSYPRRIAMRLARRSIRDQFLQAARIRRVITTADLDLGGTPQRVYINERLTRFYRQLFYKVREVGRHHNYKYVWTRNGKIFLRKDDGKPVERIRDLKDIERIFS